MNHDSTGRPIKIGDTVRFRGHRFTIKAFGPVGHRGAITIEFKEPITHTKEVPDGWSVDLIDPDGPESDEEFVQQVAAASRLILFGKKEGE